MRGCDDHHRTTRQALFAPRRVVERVPVPEELLTGGADAFFAGPRRRRDFLQQGVGALVALTAATRLKPWELLEASVAEAAANPQTILVTVYLGGGNDGLNTLVPLTGQDRTIYDASRPRLRIAAGSTLPLAGHGHVGWHPRLGGLRTLFDEGKVGAYLGVDYPNPDYSHFQSVYYWRTGQLANGATTGWLGNWLDAYGSATNPLQGVAVQWGADDLLRTHRAPTAAVYSPSDFAFWSDGIWDQDRLIDAYGHLAGPARSAARRRAMDVARQTVYVNHALKPLAGHDPPPVPVAYPGSGTGDALRNLARMLGAGLGIRVATVQADGAFDSHENQLASHGDDLADVGDALLAFQRDLEARGLDGRVLTLVWSEFGRRVEDNASNGTDHGAGSLVLAVGQRARPVVSNGWHLADAARYDGNVPVAVDFRDLYAGIIDGHLGGDVQRCLPGYRGTPVAVVA
jgi:uncharacterized protein (DUF1501 family)